MKPYYADDSVTLYCGDMREVLPQLSLQADVVVADPPYGETRLGWDRWPDGWVMVVSPVAPTMWCFGSMRLFTTRWVELTAEWTYSQDLVWQKNSGSGFKADRFMRVHESIALFYRGSWSDRFKSPPREHVGRPSGKTVNRRSSSDHLGRIGGGLWTDDGTRLLTSVRAHPKVHGGIHPTEKPTALLRELLDYVCPPGGLILDPFAGSCSTGIAARLTGRRAVLIEADEAMCEKAVRVRLLQDVLPLGVTP